MIDPKQCSAKPQADGDGYQVMDVRGTSRKVYRFPRKQVEAEPVPVGAGSFHDPEHHRRLMDRFEAIMYANSGPS
jgi:hypothetical protein